MPKNVISPFREGPVFMDFKDEKIRKEDMIVSLNAPLGLPEQYSFTLFNESKDFLGFEHIAYQQLYRGIPIEEGMVLLHTKDGFVASLNGWLGKVPEQLPVQPALDEKSAITFAAEELGLVPGYRTPDVSLVFTQDIVAESQVLTYKVNLEGKRKDNTYNRVNVFVDATTGKIIKKISLIAHVSELGTAHTRFSGVREITVDNTGGVYKLYDSSRNITTVNFDKAVIASNGVVGNLLDYTNAGSIWDEVLTLDSVMLLTAGDTSLIQNRRSWRPALYILGDKVTQYPILGPVFDYSGTDATPFIFSELGFSLQSPPYNIGLTSRNSSANRNSGSAYFTIDSADVVTGTHSWSDSLGNAGQYVIRQKANPALDAHWGMARSYDYFKEFFGRSGYNGRNSPVINMINASYSLMGDQSNAAAISYGNNGVMAFGLGDRHLMDAVVCLDVLGHEFTHMVTGNSGQGGLVYQGESGALNESFSDIFGTCIEFYAKRPTANWTIGEESYLRAPFMYRSMAEPKLRSNPDTYQGQYWINPAQISNDNGGVHYNSGVQNKWFYLLCEGGTGTNDKNEDYRVTGIGMEKAQQIAYRNLTTYLTPYAKYLDAYRGSLKAAEDLFGSDGPEYQAVVDAWFAVGIGATTSLPRTLATAATLSIYPNPASDEINMVATMVKPGKASVMVADVNGREVMKKELGSFAAGDNSIKLDLRALSAGTYWVTLDMGTDKITTKIAVHR